MDWIDEIESRVLCRDSGELGETYDRFGRGPALHCRFCGGSFDTTSNKLPVHDAEALYRIEPADVRRLIAEVRRLRSEYASLVAFSG